MAVDNAESQKAATLQAIAQAGQAGKLAQQSASTDNAAQGQAAAAAALAPPAAAGTTPGYADQIAQQAAAPQIAAAEGIGRTSQATDIYNTGMLGAAGNSYARLGQQQAAQNAVTSENVRRIRADNAKAAEEKQRNTKTPRTITVYNEQTGEPEQMTVNMTDDEYADWRIKRGEEARDKKEKTPIWERMTPDQQAVNQMVGDSWSGEDQAKWGEFVQAKSEGEAMNMVRNYKAEWQRELAKKETEVAKYHAAHPDEAEPTIYFPEPDWGAMTQAVHRFFSGQAPPNAPGTGGFARADHQPIGPGINYDAAGNRMAPQPGAGAPVAPGQAPAASVAYKRFFKGVQ